MSTNIIIARAEAEYCNQADSGRPFGTKASGWFGEDSDFPTRFWRIGGNAVICEGHYGLEAMRWHELVRSTAHMRYPAH